MSTQQENSSLFVEGLLKQLEEKNDQINKILASLKTSDSIAFVLGDTGAGKSSLINYLSGNPLKVIKKPFKGNSFLIESAGQGNLKIGHKFSQTKIPSVVKTKEGIMIVDTAGANDTQGFKADIQNGIILKKIFNSVQNKKIIMVLNSDSFGGSRGELLKGNFQRLNNFFGQNFNEILFIISKAERDTDYKDWIIDLIQTDDSQYIEKNRQFLLRIMKSSQIIPFYQPQKQDFLVSEKQGGWNTEERTDRVNIISTIKTLKTGKVENMSLTFDGQNARNIESLTLEIKKKAENSFSTLTSLLAAEWEQLQLSKIISFEEQHKKNKIKSHSSNGFSLYFSKLSANIDSFGTEKQKKIVQQVFSTIEKKVTTFNTLLENIFVNSLENTKEAAVIDVTEEVQVLQQNNDKELKRIIEAKGLEEQARISQEKRKKEEQARIKAEQQKRKAEQEKRKADEAKRIAQQQARAAELARQAAILEKQFAERQAAEEKRRREEEEQRRRDDQARRKKQDDERRQRQRQERQKRQRQQYQRRKDREEEQQKERKRKRDEEERLAEQRRVAQQSYQQSRSSSNSNPLGGATIGATTGALVAGPPGAIIGGVIGAIGSFFK